MAVKMERELTDADAATCGYWYAISATAKKNLAR